MKKYFLMVLAIVFLALSPFIFGVQSVHAGSCTISTTVGTDSNCNAITEPYTCNCPGSGDPSDATTASCSNPGQSFECTINGVQTFKSYGVAQCSCSVPAPTCVSNVGSLCPLTSAGNTCNQTTTEYVGTISCNGTCVGTPPSAPALSGAATNYGQTCQSSNACLVNATYDCNGNCVGGTSQSVNGGWSGVGAWTNEGSCGTYQACKQYQDQYGSCTNPSPSCGGSACSSSNQPYNSQWVDCGATAGYWSLAGQPCVNNVQTAACVGAVCGGGCSGTAPAAVCGGSCDDNNSCTTDSGSYPSCTHTNNPVNGTWTYAGQSCVNGTKTAVCSGTLCDGTCPGSAPTDTSSCGTVTCSSNTGCNDNNTNTTDVCQNPGTVSSFCTNSPTCSPTSAAWACNGSTAVCNPASCGGTPTTCSGAAPSCGSGGSYSYSWYQSGFGSCSVACGGGTQSQTVFCQRSDGLQVADSSCSGTKPNANQTCNTQACSGGSGSGGNGSTAYLLNVTKSVGGSVTSNDAHISCGLACSYSYSSGSFITLTETPSSSTWKFIGWSGDCTGTSSTCNLTISAAKNVYARFAPNPLQYQEF